MSSTTGSPRVFISYRREDSIAIAGRIRDEIVARFGVGNALFDVDSIPPGIDFRQHIDKMVADSDVVLVIIGRHWLDARDDRGLRRLDDSTDWVRLEVEAALRRGIPVVPVLIDSATMPREATLPSPLAELAYRNASPVRYDPDFHTDMGRLIERLGATVARGHRPAGDFVKRAEAKSKAGDLNGAIDDCTEALRINPASGEAMKCRAWARFEQGDLEEAIADCSEALRLDATDYQAYAIRYGARRKKGDRLGALRDWTQAARYKGRV